MSLNIVCPAHDRPTARAGNLICCLILATHRLTECVALLDDGVRPRGYEAMVDSFLASLPPTLASRRLWRYSRVMADFCIAEYYGSLREHYSGIADNVAASLAALADRPDWAEAWELGVRWASFDPRTAVTQRTLHRVMARLPYDLVLHA